LQLLRKAPLKVPTTRNKPRRNWLAWLLNYSDLYRVSSTKLPKAEGSIDELPVATATGCRAGDYQRLYCFFRPPVAFVCNFEIREQEL